MRAMSVLLAGIALAPAALCAQEVYWIEGERAGVSSWQRHSWYSETRRDPQTNESVPLDRTLLSDRKWISHWSKGPGEVHYTVELPAAGEYALWVRGVMRANIQWKLDGGEFQRADLAGDGIQPVALGEGPRTVAWKMYGRAKLSAGRHTVVFLASPVTEGPHVPWAFGGIDCLVLAAGEFKPEGAKRPANAKELNVLPPSTGDGGWFDFTSAPDDFSESVIDVSGLLDKPAGKRGPLTIEGGSLVFADGTRIKFLGTNLCNRQPGCPKPTSDATAARFAKYGINAVRFHKFCHPGEAVRRGAATSTELDPGYMDLMDYLHAEFRKRGIYVGWSPIYGHRVVRGDGVVAFGELQKIGGNTAGIVDFAPDVQTVHIRLLTNLLNHKNPQTGLRYAEDPALAFVEIQNEDDVFWNYRNQVNACPTYKKMLEDQFLAWLEEKYKTEAARREAWGDRAMNDPEGLITMHGWWYTEAAYGITDSGDDRSHLRRKTLDAAQFLHETQNKFYSRVVEAIRATGYKGPIIGSCWKTSPGVGFYYNLRSDALVGIVDRHSYFGGLGTHRLRPGPFNNSSQLARPGSGILGNGVQQVGDRPFMISEWLTLLPTMWVAEGQAILGAYGMCLQDWDGIFMFASDHAFPPRRWDAPRVYTADQPAILGANPALAYWVLRGDVRSGQPIIQHRVRVEDLHDGVLTVKDAMENQGDIKALAAGGSTPPEAFAIGRVTTDFVGDEGKSIVGDLRKYWNPGGKIVRSNTGELVWDYSGEGFFTLDTPRSKAVCGFVRGKDLTLGNVDVTGIDTRFVALYLSSIEGRPIGEPGRVMVIALARTRNKGMVYNADETQVLKAGGPPMQLEAVRATITLTLPSVARPPVVNVLDHYGRRTGRTVPVAVKDGRPSFRIDEQFKAIYYEIVVP